MVLEFCYVGIGLDAEILARCRKADFRIFEINTGLLDFLSFEIGFAHFFLKGHPVSKENIDLAIFQ